jgi:hypothetical protein
VVATFPAAFTVRQLELADVPRAVMAKFVVVALPVKKLVEETFPGNNTVCPDCPMVIPVAEFVPIEMVPVVSMMLFESPMMLVPLNVNAAEAIDTPAKTTKATAAARPPPMRIFFIFIVKILSLLRRLYYKSHYSIAENGEGIHPYPLEKVGRYFLFQ